MATSVTGSVLQAKFNSLKKYLTVLVAVTSLSGCYDIVSVDQPPSTQIEQVFTATVTGGASSTCTNCKPSLGIAVPASWTIADCQYRINLGAPLSCTADTDDPPIPDLEETPDIEWRKFLGSPVEIAQQDSIVVEWQVVPNTAGTYSLAYILGAQDLASAPQAQYSDIARRELIVGEIPPVPAMGAIHWTLLALGLMAIVFVYMAKTHRRFGPIKGVFIALLFVWVTGNGEESAADSEIKPMALSHENILSLIMALRSSETQVILEDPKTFAAERFLLSEPQKLWLSSADEDVLRQSIELMLSTESLSTVSCYVIADKFKCSEKLDNPPENNRGD